MFTGHRKCLFNRSVKFREKKIDRKKCRERERKKCLHHNHHDCRRRIIRCASSSSVGYFIFGQDALNAQAVFRIVEEKVDILIAINFYLHSNFTVQMARLGDSRPCH